MQWIEWPSAYIKHVFSNRNIVVLYNRTVSHKLETLFQMLMDICMDVGQELSETQRGQGLSDDGRKCKLR